MMVVGLGKENGARVSYKRKMIGKKMLICSRTFFRAGWLALDLQTRRTK
jgi:hypothetical protein